MKYDLAVIGGGIVGLSTGYQIINKFPNTKMVILEKKIKLLNIKQVIIAVSFTQGYIISWLIKSKKL